MPGLSLEDIREQLLAIERRIADVATEDRLKAEWYTAADCARLKGISQAVLTMNRWMRPLGGAGARRIARRERWHRSVVKEWLLQDDDALLELYGRPADRERYRHGMAQSKAS